MLVFRLGRVLGMRFRVTAPAVITIALLVTGCGTTAPNADVNQGLTGLTGRTAVVPDTAVIEIVDTGPAVQDGGRRVFGTSCKNKIWDPAPSRDNALALMKRQAVDLGFNAIHSVQVRNDPSAIAKNCWAAIVAEGVAFTRMAR